MQFNSNAFEILDYIYARFRGADLLGWGEIGQTLKKHNNRQALDW